MAVNTIGAEPNDPLSYALGLEHYLQNMSKLGGHGVRLYKERKSKLNTRNLMNDHHEHHMEK